MASQVNPEPGVETPAPNMRSLQDMMRPELRGHLDSYSPSYASSQYLDLATDEDIDAFLNSSPLYDIDAGEWTNLVGLHSEADMITRVQEIINAIIRTFGAAHPDESVTREICIPGHGKFTHVENNTSYNASSPTMVVKASGPSFQNPLGLAGEAAPSLGYTNVTSCFQFDLEWMREYEDEFYAEQSSVYARQMFIQQPNRRFVRNLLITEEFVYLFHFDRSGAQYTPSTDIHRYPETFIRLILGLSSTDEELLGFDTSVQWVIENGRKSSGSITVEDVEGGKTKYDLCDVEPCYRRCEMFGRGVVGWRATDSKGKEVFIKDGWRSENGPVVEYEAMKGAVGVTGAAQLLKHEARERSTSHIRANGCDEWTLDWFENRISTRMVMESYGGPITSFKSQTDVAAAMRDAIAAHRTLVNERHILHCDISHNNILLGKENAKPGERGVLADFDLAHQGRRPLEMAAGDPITGTMPFISIALLSSSNPDEGKFAPYHDQLDDLESFYYNLYVLMNSWEGPGKRVETLPDALGNWYFKSMWLSGCMKLAHFDPEDAPDMTSVPAYWSPAMRELVCGMYRIIRKVVLKKIDNRDVNCEAVRYALQNTLEKADAIYDDILSLFDIALESLNTQELTSSEPPVTSPAPNNDARDSPSDRDTSPSPLKRAAPCDLKGAPAPRKRARCKAPPPPRSPHRTRAYVKALAACASNPASKLSPEAPQTVAPEVRITRAAAKAAQHLREEQVLRPLPQDSNQPARTNEPKGKGKDRQGKKGGRI